VGLVKSQTTSDVDDFASEAMRGPFDHVSDEAEKIGQNL
jgi:hypothetical protein